MLSGNRAAGERGACVQVQWIVEYHTGEKYDAGEFQSELTLFWEWLNCSSRDLNWQTVSDKVGSKSIPEGLKAANSGHRRRVQAGVLTECHRPIPGIHANNKRPRICVASFV
jgi:hypothetical protein